MGYEAEFGRGWDVPGFIEFLVSKEILDDLSWKNDVAPFFGKQDEKTGQRFGIWIDHPIESVREIGGPRFSVVLGESGTSMDHDESYVELEEALEDLFKCYGQWAERFDPENAVIEDPWEYKNELLAEFYDRR